MAYSFTTSVVLARRRHGGQVVFLSEADCWTPVLAEAELLDDEAHADIRLLDAEMSGAGLYDIRLAEVDSAAGTPLRLLPGSMTAA